MLRGPLGAWSPTGRPDASSPGPAHIRGGVFLTLETRRIVFLSLILAGVVALTGVYLHGKGVGRQPRYRTARVERGPLSATISTTGTLNAVITVQVGTQVSGQVSQLFADFNSHVKKGQVIARIDPQAFEARVSQARADVESAEANVLNQRAQVERARAEVSVSQARVQNQRSQVERARADVENARAALAAARAQTAKAQVALLDARRDLDRKLGLFKKELISRSDLDSAQAVHDSAAAQVEASEAQEQALASTVRSAQAQLESSRSEVEALISGVRSAEAQLQVAEAQARGAEANVRQKRAALEQATVDLAYTVIRSPVDGVVVSRNVDVGQTVAASLAAPTLFTIAQDLTKMQVDTNVDEADIGRIEAGQRAEFTVDSFRGETFTGEVAQIRMAPKVVQNVVTYNVVLAVDNPSKRLLPGLTANARITVASRPDVLKIPNAALRFREDGDESEPEASPSDAQSLSPTSAAALEEMRQLLTRELGLARDQQRALASILEEQREQLVGLDRVPGQQRRAVILRIRDETQAKIRAVLTPEQARRYEQLPVGQPASPPSRGRPGTVWVLDPRGTPRAVPVRLGVTDSAFTELVEGDLKEGQEVVLGTSVSPESLPAPSSTSATAPRLLF